MNTNQSHYCGDLNTIGEYIEDTPEEHRETLQRVREIIRTAMPEATEKLITLNGTDETQNAI